jgi:trigger factor
MLEINEVEYCKVNVKYTADPETVKSKTADALNELRKLQIPGFRKNKAPDVAIKAKYKMRIHEYVKREMLQSSFEDVLFETKIQPIGQPQTLDMKLDGNNFNCEFLILKKPEFELQEVKGLEIPKPHQQVTQEAYVEQILQELRTKNGDSAPYSEGDFVQTGDTLTLDYETNELDKDVFVGEFGKLYTVGANLLPEFDENILGMTPDENREFSILKDGKKVDVKVTLHMGMKKTPAPLDDSLAVKVGMENLNKLREAVEGIATTRLKQHSDSQIAEQIKKQLIALHPFEIPAWLVSLESNQMIKNAGVDEHELTEEQKTDLTKRAEDSVRFALVLDTVRAKVPEADLSDQEVLNLIKQRVSGQVADPDAFLLDMQKKNQLINTVAQIRNEITLQFLMENAKLIE